MHASIHLHVCVYVYMCIHICVDIYVYMITYVYIYILGFSSNMFSLQESGTLLGFFMGL